MQSELIERIKQRLGDLDMTPRELSKKARLGQDFVSELLRGRKKNVRSDNLDLIARVLETSTQWLLTGSDSAPQMPDVEHGPRGNIPEIDMRAGGGAGGFEDLAEPYDPGGGQNRVKAVWTIPPAYLRGEFHVDPRNVRIIEVAGDSMTPTLMPHDRILVDISHRQPSPPGVYALWDGFGLVVKRVEILHGTDPLRVLLSSDNPYHPDRELTLDEAHIAGRVVARITGL